MTLATFHDIGKIPGLHISTVEKHSYRVRKFQVTIMYNIRELIQSGPTALFTIKIFRYRKNPGYLNFP